MATPKGGYWLDNERLPGTTTIISRYKDSGGLIWWSWEEGYKQCQRGDPLKHKETVQQAADIGTAAHTMIESHINGEMFETAKHPSILMMSEADQQKACNAYDMYMKWEQQTGIQFLSKYQEIQLVCPILSFGGTPDAIGEINGEIVLLDWKTSNKVYPDYLLQLAAYKHLINNGVRMDNLEPLPFKVSNGAHLLRFAKEYPDFGHHYFGEMDDAWESFKLMRALYEFDKTLKKRVS